MAIDDRDMGAVGNVARAAKATSGTQELREFSVKRGDNGGVIVCEVYRTKAPEGRRYGASFPESSDYKENPFSPTDGAGATAFVKGLLGKMGIAGAAPSAAAVVGPDRAVARGPFGGGAMRGPAGSAVRGPGGAGIASGGDESY